MLNVLPDLCFPNEDEGKKKWKLFGRKKDKDEDEDEEKKGFFNKIFGGNRDKNKDDDDEMNPEEIFERILNGTSNH